MLKRKVVLTEKTITTLPGSDYVLQLESKEGEVFMGIVESVTIDPEKPERSQKLHFTLKFIVQVMSAAHPPKPLRATFTEGPYMLSFDLFNNVESLNKTEQDVVIKLKAERIHLFLSPEKVREVSQMVDE